ncbi:MAG: class I SAM-dependent methyltransferase [Phycisphaerae bacterium]|nr:class I SAM-dependent methyltransferase [Phycisphaerae bacterium]
MTRNADWFTPFFGGLYSRVLAASYDAERSLVQARRIKSLLRLRRGQRVLDIPCGQGRLTIPLAKMGLAMTGVDLMPGYIRTARRSARQERLDVRFVQRDMRDIAFDGEFDAAFNWFTSIGYFSDADNLAFCRRIHRALRPGGQFAVETMNASWYVSHLHGRFEETKGGIHIVHEAHWDPKARRCRDRWTMWAGGKTETHQLSLRVYTGAEMRAMLKAAGFRDIRLFAGPKPGRLTRHTPRLIAIGAK